MDGSPGALGVFSRMDYKNWWERNSFLYREGFGNKGTKSLLGRNANQMEEPKIKDDEEKKEVAVSVSYKQWGERVNSLLDCCQDNSVGGRG